MDQGQERFYEFILNRVEEEKKDRAIQLLEDSFQQQANGTFDKEYIDAFAPKLMELVKTENVEEVKNVMEGYRHTNIV
jgi:hypothetical protein